MEETNLNWEIKKKLAERQMLQRDLAVQLEVSEGYISRLVRGGIADGRDIKARVAAPWGAHWMRCLHKREGLCSRIKRGHFFITFILTMLAMTTWKLGRYLIKNNDLRREWLRQSKHFVV